MWVQLPPLQPFMLRVAQMVRAPGCGPGGRRFETGHAPHGFLAQLVERQTEDLRVPGPIPGEPTTYGRMPESGQKERTVNSLASAYVGSNPTSPTNYTAGIFTTNSERGTVSTVILIVWKLSGTNVCGRYNIYRKSKEQLSKFQFHAMIGGNHEADIE